VLELLGTVYRARTLVLWSLIAVNLSTLYVLISWLPTLLQAAGWQLAPAVRAAVLIQAGGVIGGIVLSVSLDRGQTRSSLFAAFLVAAACLGLFIVVPSGVGWSVLLLLIGCGVSGPQLSLNALATAYYPPAIKATGMGWAGVVGTVGSIIAPLAGGQIIEVGFTPVTILVALSLGPIVCACGVLLMRREWQD
jgi:AAHS family 4-hydroxybenzoate transporter-like MFS transporter